MARRPRKNHNPEEEMDLDELLPEVREIQLTPVGQVNPAVDIGRPIRTDDDLIDFGQRLASTVVDGAVTVGQARILTELFSTMATLRMAGRAPGQSTTTVLATLLQMGGSSAAPGVGQLTGGNVLDISAEVRHPQPVSSGG